MPPHLDPPLPPTDDLALVRALRTIGQGGLGAFAQFYDLTADRVFGLALRVLGDADEAEQVTRDVFGQVWRDAGGYDLSRGTVLGWLQAMTHRRAVDRLRRTETRFASAAMEVHGSPEAERVLAALAVLAPAERQAVELAYHEGHTHSEVERLTQAPTGAAASRIRDGLLRLAALLVTPAVGSV